MGKRPAVAELGHPLGYLDLAPPPRGGGVHTSPLPPASLRSSCPGWRRTSSCIRTCLQPSAGALSLSRSRSGSKTRTGSPRDV